MLHAKVGCQLTGRQAGRHTQALGNDEHVCRLPCLTGQVASSKLKVPLNPKCMASNVVVCNQQPMLALTGHDTH
jgi:hypothetical protein